ncbi:MAG: hypothetical protein AAGD04_09695 [Pseudomonadota bacterium]
MKNLLFVAGLAVALSGCASPSSTIKTENVSAKNFAGLDCRALRAEAIRAHGADKGFSRKQDLNAAHDQRNTAVAVFLFRPAIFTIRGGQGNPAKIRKARGEVIAIQEAGLAKDCNYALEQQAGRPVWWRQ